MWNFELTEASLIPIISLIGTLCLIGWQIYKWITGERKGLNATSAEAISEAASRLVTPLSDRVEELEKKNKALEENLIKANADWKEKFDKLSGEYTQMQGELALFKDWAQRLVFQIQSYGETPVPMIKKDYSKMKKDGQ